MKKIINLILLNSNDYRSLIPRIVVGLIFLSEGIQKFINPAKVGAGRFESIGFEHFEFLSYFVATFEVVCGVALLIGLLTRLFAIPIITIMSVAIVTTKIPKLLNDGFWTMAHDSRTDFAMIMLVIYLLIYGAGKLSIDKLIQNKCNGYD